MTLVFERILLGHTLKCPAASFERFSVGCTSSEHPSTPGTSLNAPPPTRIGCKRIPGRCYVLYSAVLRSAPLSISFDSYYGTANILVSDDPSWDAQYPRIYQVDGRAKTRARPCRCFLQTVDVDHQDVRPDTRVIACRRFSLQIFSGHLTSSDVTKKTTGADLRLLSPSNA